VSEPSQSRGPRPLSAEQARQAFRRPILGSEGEFLTTKHFKERMIERHFDMADVLHLARTGVIHNPPEWDTKHGEWLWRIEGKAVDGRRVYVVFSLPRQHQVKGVTIETPAR
jgi:uncharacterized protein DUF4258